MKQDPASKVAVTKDGVLRLSGRIGYSNADVLLPIGSKALSDGAVKRIDLSGLEGSDSATLAILLAWAAQSRRGKQVVPMSGAPEGLRALARLANAETLLGLS